MLLESPEGINELRASIQELRDEYGSVGLKMSTEDRGNSWEFIDYMQNRILEGLLPLNVKVGGPDAKNDIRTFVRIGASGIIAPMVESPFGVHKFVTALKNIVGEKAMKPLLVSVNLESVTAYKNIDEILAAPETEEIDQIVIGTTDLARSVVKPIHDPYVQRMVIEMSRRCKNTGKVVRLGGVMSMAHKMEENLKLLLRDAQPDKINTGNVCFDISKIPELRSAYIKASNFEYKLNRTWLKINEKRMQNHVNRMKSLEKKSNRFLEPGEGFEPP